MKRKSIQDIAEQAKRLENATTWDAKFRLDRLRLINGTALRYVNNLEAHLRGRMAAKAFNAYGARLTVPASVYAKQTEV